MASFERYDVPQAFRNNRQLQQFFLTDVTATGRILGTGSYGSVEEVIYQHITCAGKRLHEILFDIENDGMNEVVSKYLQECQLMSSLRHPNITQFLGLCFLPGTQLPLLVMERLESSLDDLLEHMPNLPLSLKHSILVDVASGLLYLHKRNPPVIHRDLTAKNVLLTSSLVAKITDMGNSRIIDMTPSQMARTLSNLPGTLVYMPPEARDDSHYYGPSLDIFSFGHLALYTIIQKFPSNLLPSTYFNPANVEEVRGRTEVECRGKYIDLLEAQIISDHPILVQLVKQCLHNAPHQRPTSDELLAILQRMREELEGEYGGPVKLDMVRVRLVKKIKMKDRRIEELTQQQERHRTEIEMKTREVERLIRELERAKGELGGTTRTELSVVAGGAKRLSIGGATREIDGLTRELEMRDRHIEELQAEIQLKDEQLANKTQELAARDRESAIRERELSRRDREIARKDRELARKDTEIGIQNDRNQQLQREIAAKDCRIQAYELQQETPQPRENQLRGELQSKEAEISQLREELRKFRGLIHVQKKTRQTKVQLKLPLRLNWKSAPVAPIKMGGYVQAVVVQKTVYVGGGDAWLDSDNDYVVMAYDTSSGQWAKLPSYKVCDFVMTVIDKELVLVGGSDGDLKTKVLGVWRAETKEWVYSLPEMSLPRSGCSASVSGEWLVVAGGRTDAGITSSVEVLNTDSKQWYAGPPTPIPWAGMKTAIVGDMHHFMGGMTIFGGTIASTHCVYSVSIPALISQVSLNITDEPIWEEISGLHITDSTPLSISGSLLAVGGCDKDISTVSVVHLYNAGTGKWMKVGDLPTPRCQCACAMISEGELFVAGGIDSGMMTTDKVDMALINR